MDCTDLDKSALLEEVFNEVDALFNNSEESVKNKSSGFLEDIVNFEKELLSTKKKKEKDKPVDNSKPIVKEQSLLYDGNMDSSDEEDNKYFEESRYNECGKNLILLLKQKTVSNDYLIKETPKKENTWTKVQAAKEKLKTGLNKFNNAVHENNTDKKNLLVDPVLGMCIINPLVSSAVLKEKMIGRISVKTSNVKKFIETASSKDSDWVTGGVIISKTSKTSQKGNQYIIWSLTDLNGDIKTISVFLFGSAYKEYWKISIGTVVGILNPTVMNSNDKSEATFKVDNAQKILLMGTSKDYGLCKSKKKNGERCMSVVNTAKCDFCIYHMKKEYIKACRRSDLQPPKIGRSIENIRDKILKQNTIIHGGKVFGRVVGKKSSKQVKKDEERLKNLSQKPQILNQAEVNRNNVILNRLNDSSGSIITSTPPMVVPQVPTLPLQNKEIDLNFTVSKKERSAAKANALKYVLMHGPLKKVTESEKKKKTPEQISSLKRKLEEDSPVEDKKIKIDSNSTEKSSVPDNLKKRGITEEFLKLMNSEVRSADLLKQAETKEREKYFNKLEIKEKIEEKMASTFKVECKAVRCLKCNYKSFSASDLCKKEKHPLKVVNAVKRFWKCGDCFARTVCLELIPLHCCKTCGSSKWERASMMREKKGPNLAVEPLSVRGEEEKFIGAVVKNPNLNLLVPENPS